MHLWCTVIVQISAWLDESGGEIVTAAGNHLPFGIRQQSPLVNLPLLGKLHGGLVGQGVYAVPMPPLAPTQQASAMA